MRFPPRSAARSSGRDRIDALRRDKEFVLSRCFVEQDDHSVLMLAPTSERPPPRVLERLKHEYALREQLDPAWAARPRALTSEHDRTVLLLEDPGAELLARLLGPPWGIEEFLRVAAGIAEAVGRVHAQGLIHRDIRPDHLFVDTARGAAWLTGFGMASRLTRERQAPDLAEIVPETLPYMAPEQTGRMNRSVDSRSDLYSLGVILYQMLTGTPPFQASEAMEWIHCHIARQPVPPAERLHAIPATVSALVLRLLAKNAEDRYQTAAGVETDLRRCLSEWQSTGRIEPFTLAARDVPDRLLIPERLYGREHEVGILVDAFERVAREGRQALALVSGYSGVGKSSIVNELQRAVVRARGLFASGKFEPQDHDIPFAPIVRAFRDLMRSILASSEADLQRWREDILRALGENAQLVIDLVPEVALVIGPQKPVADLPPQQARIRFQTTLERFVGVFARPEHPFVLFVDDLQWLDRATLDLVRNLATAEQAMHLLLVGAYRDNEVGPAHPLSEMLAAIRTTAVVQEIALVPLDAEEGRALISDALHQDPQQTEALADAVYEKTAGNPFFVIEFLRGLAGEGLLAFDARAGTWTSDLVKIRSKGYTENVFDLLAGKLDRLPAPTQEALQSLACLSTGRTDALSVVQGCSEDELHAALSAATEAGLVDRTERSYAFSHDRIREAAYALVPEGERAALHLRIGRSLLPTLTAADASERAFEVVTQLNRGASLVSSTEERLRIAELNLTAGRRARASCAYGSALTYLAVGEALLSEEDWERNYGLRFSLALDRGECEFLTGELAAADERLSRLKERASGRPHLAAVACLRMAVYTTLDRTDRAVAVGLEQLRQFGVDWSAHPSAEEVLAEYSLLRKRVGERPIETLADLPSVRDPDPLALMEVLEALETSAVFTDKNLHDLAVMRVVNLSLEHGHCDASTLAYAHLSMVLGPRFAEHRDGFRFGEFAIALVDRGDFARFRGKVYTVVGYHVLPWTRPLQAACSLIRRALDLARETGDLVFAAFNSCHLISLHLAAGDPLGGVQSEAERHLQSTRRAGFGLVVDCILGQLSLIRSLRGASANPAVDIGGLDHAGEPDKETENLERRLREDPRLAIGACFYWIRKLQACVHAGDDAAALQMGATAEPLLWTNPTFFELAEFHFYSALAHAGAWNPAKEAEATVHREALAAHHAQLATWAARCAETFEGRAALAAAELARLEDRVLDAARLYEEAIRSAHAANAIDVEALAGERAARFYLQRDFDRIALAYLKHARSCYERWGAEAVVRRLDRMLLEADATPGPATAATATPAEGLDLSTVIKASQAISGEILIDKLVEKLMVAAIQHAGAERGLLILRQGEDTRIEAEAMTQAEGVAVRFRDATVSSSDLPDSLLRFVVRTQEPVILDDASTSNPFAADRYVVEKRARSVMCLPLVKQAELVGALYLENNLASHVFTQSRIEVVKLLASQAAISLQNARLYEELNQENSERKRAEAQMRASEARFSAVFRNSPSPLALQTVSDGRFVDVNPAWEGLFGYQRDQVVGRTTQEIGLYDDSELREQLYRTLARDRYLDRVGITLRSVEGRQRLCLLSARQVEIGSEHLVVTGLIDVTEADRAEKALRESEERFALAVAGANEGIFDWDLASNRVYLSQRAQELWGLSPGELQRDRKAWQSMITFHPEDVAHIRDSVKAHIVGAAPTFDVEYRTILPDGSVRWFRQRGIALRDASGTAYRMVGSIGDITDRKRAQEELLRLERQLRQAQRLESVGTLAGGIAHDFNNILGAILGYGEMALRGVARGSRLRRDLDSIMAAGERGRVLVERILAFSRSGVGERVAVHVEKVVSEALELMSAKLPAGITIETGFKAGRAAMLGDATQVHQVLMNLATNAVQAMGSRGTLRVSVDVTKLKEPRVAATGTLPAGEYVVLEVADDGTGMPAEVLERIFDPFFTTKEVGVGTGLGLSLVHGIVSEVGGAVEVRSTVGEGSVFTVYLPRAGDAPEEDEEEEGELPRGDHQQVMVVDDEEPLVKLVTENLAELGYVPVGFTSSVAALEAFRAHPERYDAVITDERMPNLSGVALLGEIRGIRPSVPTVLVSGYMGADLLRRAEQAGADEVLRKPLSLRDLATALARSLNGSHSRPQTHPANSKH